MTKKTIKSTLALAILGLVSQNPMTGYDLRKVFTTTPMWHMSSSPGAVYPALQRLEEAGWIKGAVEGKDTLRPKRVYALTKEGMEALRQRLEEPVTQEDVIQRRDELIMRFVFIGDILGHKKARRYLEELIVHVENYIHSLQAYLNIVRETESPCDAFGAEHIVEVYQTYIRWAKRVIDELD